MGPLEKLAEKGDLMMYKLKGEWACMDNYRDMKYLDNLYKNNKAFWKVW